MNHPPRAGKGASILGTLFLLFALALAGWLTSHQMSATRGLTTDARPFALVICSLGALAGVAGLGVSLVTRANSDRRVALLTYAFGTALLLFWVINLLRS